MQLPAPVSELTHFFLEAVDSAAPGLIQGLYLTGSVALDDFQEHSSDVDFVALSAQRARGEELQGVAAAHASLRGRYPDLDFDGTHLSWSDLAAGPQACAPAPFSHEGRFESSGLFAINPVTWHELATHGVTVRGPAPTGLQIWHDAATLHHWTLNNLKQYWLPWLDRYRAGPAGVEQLNDLVVWGILGVTRLHYTLATGQITSKSGAGRYALSAFREEWRPIISEALRLHVDPAVPSEYADLSERRRQVVSFMERVIDSALSTTAHDAIND